MIKVVFLLDNRAEMTYNKNTDVFSTKINFKAENILRILTAYSCMNHSIDGFVIGMVGSIRSQTWTESTCDNATSSISVTKRSPFSILRKK